MENPKLVNVQVSAYGGHPLGRNRVVLAIGLQRQSLSGEEPLEIVQRRRLANLRGRARARAVGGWTGRVCHGEDTGW